MKKIIIAIASIAMAVALASCGASAPVETEATATDAEIAKALTENYFSKVNIDMYSFGDAVLEPAVVEAKAYASVKACVSDPQFVALNKKGYKVYAVGHGCKFGGSSANYQMGLSRAKQVSMELRGLKISPNYLGYKSVGDKVMESEEFGGAPEQRRVTFEVAKK